MLLLCLALAVCVKATLTADKELSERTEILPDEDLSMRTDMTDISEEEQLEIPSSKTIADLFPTSIRLSDEPANITDILAGLDGTPAPKKNTGKTPSVYGGSLASQSVANFIAVIIIRTATGYGTCTGSVISRTQVLTNAHCFVNSRRQLVVRAVYIGVGLRDTNTLSNSNVKLVSAIDILSSYNPSRNADDLAVVWLRSDLGSRQPTSRYSIRSLSSGTLVRIAGYGASEYSNGGASRYLLETNLAFITISTCRRTTTILSQYETKKRCFTSPSSARRPATSCGGDSGAPIFYIAGSGKMYQYATNTYGVGACGSRSKLSVGMSLRSYRTYLSGIVRGSTTGWTRVATASR